jgi:hypothetical protein
MSRNKFTSADDAVKLIKDGDIVALIGGDVWLLAPTRN